jgi:hypothetical protein
VTVTGLRAGYTTKDGIGIVDTDGKGDEIMAAAFVRRFSRVTAEPLEYTSLQTMVYGDVNGYQTERVQGGPAHHAGRHHRWRSDSGRRARRAVASGPAIGVPLEALGRHPDRRRRRCEGPHGCRGGAGGRQGHASWAPFYRRYRDPRTLVDCAGRPGRGRTGSNPRQFLIEAHVDGKQSAAAQALSEQRAAAVKAALVAAGSSPIQLAAVGHGATRPIAGAKSSARIEIARTQ